MESKPISEAELGKRIVFMHDVLKMSFRKISEVLTSEGTPIGKDRVNRLYWKYKALGAASVQEGDAELAGLSKLEREAEERVETARKKNEKRRRLATLRVEEAEASFEKRRELFENKTALLDFAEKILPVVEPRLWLKLEEVCRLMQINVEDALQEAVGPQAEYEATRRESLNEADRYLLDEHLCHALEDWLSEREEEIVEASLTIEGEKGEERFKMYRPSEVPKHQ